MQFSLFFLLANPISYPKVQALNSDKWHKKQQTRLWSNTNKLSDGAKLIIFHYVRSKRARLGWCVFVVQLLCYLISSNRLNAARFSFRHGADRDQRIGGV